MNNQQEDDIIIEDVENYTPKGDLVFSHPSLVMSATRKCLEAGSKEMRTGFFNNKTDRNGNVIRTYVEDTRKAFIEAVETLEMIMICDLDSDAIKEIKTIKDSLLDKYKELCIKEQNDWSSAHINIKKARWSAGIQFKEGYLNTSLPYYQEYIDEEVKSYRNIFKVLTMMSKRNDFYATEIRGSA